MIPKRYALPDHSNIRFGALAAFVVLVFLLGGASRYDVLSLVVLRPLSFAFLLYALLVLRPGDLRAVQIPVALLLVLAAVMAAQLVPLPPSIWHYLPGREVLEQIYTAAGMEQPWLPLSLAPSRTLNSLMSLGVPLAGLLLFAVQEEGRRRAILPVLWTMGLVSVLLGIAQIAVQERGLLYLYSITNNGLPVGLFANRNHQALMVGIAILLSGYLIAKPHEPARIAKFGAALAVIICVPFLLIVGSRAGLAIGLMMILTAALLLHLEQLRGNWQGRSLRGQRVSRLIAGEFILLLVLLVGAFVVQSRSLSLDRLLASGGDFELRAQVWPVLSDLVAKNWLAGSGFGSFEFVYKMAEPVELLRPAYLNQAHNDWAQLLIEGGLPALAIMLAFLGWIVWRVAGMARELVAGRRTEALAALAIIAACGVASIADYPLRVPSLMLVFALACGFVSAAAPQARAQPVSRNSGRMAAQGEFAT